MNFDHWLTNANQDYELNVREAEGDSHFVKRIIEVSDPYRKGLSFTITVDESGAPSTFSTEFFALPWFNVAEGVDARDILNAANLCLAGNLNIKRGFLTKKYRLEYTLKTFKGRSVSANLEQTQVDDLLQGYKSKEHVLRDHKTT